jgi:predicted acylesterase/phospholipase RssA
VADPEAPRQAVTGQTSPPDECDLVMKGGITSGVVYPPLVARLAERFRLRNLGGTSAGAIAAAAAAAAEHGRRRGNAAAFAALADLPEQLGARGSSGTSSVLRELFQPSERTAGLLAVFLAACLRGSATARVARTAAALVRSFPLTTAGAVVPGVVVVAAASRGAAEIAGTAAGGGGLSGIAAAVAVGAVAAAFAGLFAAAVLGVRFLLAVASELPDHSFGLCSGMPRRVDAAPALTPWLADLLDTLAGRDPAGPPLTFGDLWGSRPSDDDAAGFPADDRREVHLQMTTTCLTLGRPFTLPLGDRRFYFDPVQLRALFPERVVRWMEQHPRRPRRAGDPVAEGRTLLPLPAAADLPVVFAARMSSSFPLLLSAIPLWAVDYSRPVHRGLRRRAAPGAPDDAASPEPDFSDDLGEPAGYDGSAEPAPAAGPTPAAAPPPPTAECCWFSDGGICSNFPVHFFDQPLPGRPTFGVNLRPFHPDLPDRAVFLAAGRGGHLEWWSRLRSGRGALPSFLGAVVATMQSWRDNVQLGVPGYRERVVHVAHHSSEGGLNLDMPSEVVDRLGARGQAAAAELVDAFAAQDPDGAWPRHRWTRFRSTMAVLQDALESFRDAYRAHGYEALLRRGPNEPPGNHRLAAARAADGHEVVERLLAVVESWAEHDEEVFRERAPRPQPELRITPRL